MQQLIHIIEANLSNADFNVKMLAEQLNMSQPTLYRKVKQRSDLSVIDMIRSIRISKAATLILENRYSIQEISKWLVIPIPVLCASTSWSSSAYLLLNIWVVLIDNLQVDII